MTEFDFLCEVELVLLNRWVLGPQTPDDVFNIWEKVAKRCIELRKQGEAE